MKTQWREFEKLIARIEKAMAPSGALVASPDHIPDKDTGELREVDASIRYKIGTSSVLITIECRDRSKIPDVRWIEQLAEKKRSIGSSITVAVSSSGFSKPAIKKASMLGIEIRTLAKMSAEDFIQWLKFENVVLVRSKWSLNGLALELYDAPDDAELVSDLHQLFRKKGPTAPIFIKNLDGKRYGVENFLIEWTKRSGTFFPEDLPPDGTKIPRNLHQPLERDLFHVETTKGKFDVRVIHIALSFWRSNVHIPISNLTEYSDPSSSLVQTAEWNIKDNIRLSLHRDLESGETKIVMTPLNEK